MGHFDLLSKPWIPIVNLNGGTEWLGFSDAILRAHELARVSDPSPAIQFGLYRWLSVLVQSAFGINEYEDVEDRWREGAFPESEWRRYIERVGTSRFDLFDRERPFMQTPAVGTAERKSVAELFYHLPKGTNALHFTYVEERSHAISPAVAARALSSIAPFMTAGGRGYSPSINGTPPWYLLPLGSNLFETLLLNCFVSSREGVFGSDPGRPAGPAWEQDVSIEPGAERPVLSLLDGLTWQPRTVRLIPSEGGICTYSGEKSDVLIREIEWGPGCKFSPRYHWRDPNVAYVIDEKGVQLPLRPRPNRHVWRDFGALFLLDAPQGKKNVHDRPDLVRQIVKLKNQCFIPDEAAEQFELYGLRADKAKLFEWHYAVLPVKTPVIKDANIAPTVEEAITLAESVSRALAASLSRLYPKTRDKKRRQLKRSIQETQYHYWAQLESAFQEGLLARLASLKPSDHQGRNDALVAWKSDVRQIATRNFEAGLSSVDSGAKAYLKQAEARRVFFGSLTAILKDKPKESSEREEATVGGGA